ncbi:MAG: hypothetical protein IPN68_09900 [Bacteroidetes bacterium]|nr:hypothetical protein [Bacteroidota bacterium]
MALAGGKLKFVAMEPITPSEAPNGTLYIDSTNANTPTYKNFSGVSEELGSGGGGGANFLLKQMQSDEAPIANKVPVSKKPNGRVIAADSDSADGQFYIGFTMESVSSVGQLFNVLLIGANVENAVSGLGFSPGDDIYLDENGGYVNTVSGFTGSNDSIIKVGVADCPAGAASAVATDLVVFSDVIARP